MNLKQTIKLAAKSIGARKGRTFLTMLGIIIGLAAVIILVTYAQGTTKQMMDLMQSMGTNQLSVYAYKYTGGSRENTVFNKLYAYCQQMDDLVVGITPNQYAWVNVMYNGKSSQSDPNGNGPQTYLGSDQWADCNNAKLAKGRNITYLDVQNTNQVCVLGSGAAEYFFNFADPVGQYLTVEGVPFRIIGVFAPRINPDTVSDDMSWYKQMDNYVLLPYTATRSLQANGSHISVDQSQFMVKARSAEAATEAAARLGGFLKGLIGDNKTGNSYGWFSISNSNSSVDYYDQASKSQQMLLGGIAAISLLVGGIGIMNIMLVTVTERTREIGIRKAIGAERKSIIIQFLVEACMICGIGGILGILVGYGGTLIVCKMALQIILLPGAGITVGSFVISVGLGIIFGLYPAIKASGLQPVEALRAE